MDDSSPPVSVLDESQLDWAAARLELRGCLRRYLSGRFVRLNEDLMEDLTQEALTMSSEWRPNAK